MSVAVHLITSLLALFALFWILRAIWRTVRLRRFHRVCPWLYRGGQPTLPALWVLARIFRIKTIINLREDFKPNEHLFGMREERILIPPSTNLPTIDQVRRFLELVDDESNRPILVHCKVGANRTGFMIAMWRILRQHWTYDQALEEMERISRKGIADHLKQGLREISEKLLAENKADD